MSPHSTTRRSIGPSALQWIGALVVLMMAVWLTSSYVQTCLSSRILVTNFVSPATWMELTGARATAHGVPDQAVVNFGAIVPSVGGLILLIWTLGAVGLERCSRRDLRSMLVWWGVVSGLWWCLIDGWEWCWIAASALGWESLADLLTLTPQLWLAVCLAGMLTTWCCLASPSNQPEPSLPLPSGRSAVMRWVAVACAIYIVIFTAMNWRLYFNLLIPHGDSAMYEEHLWNVLHGKGFRSYLDQGLFLGEHIQVVHLFLIPLYLLWPSHLLLELSESTALALGAFPVFWMTCRQTGSERAGLAAAVAYLLYAPLQSLDIEIDLKTFRPEAFGIPLLLLTLDQLERRNLRGFWIALLFTLTVKEDYAIVFAPLGLWILWRESSDARLKSAVVVSSNLSVPAARSRVLRAWTIAGISLAFGSVAYLWLATRVVMPWFRSGAEIHYAGYFRKFGSSPEQIVFNMVTQPGLLFGELVTTSTILYALAMLAPVAFLPLFSGGRLAVGIPLFGILCLNSLARDPRHHFHAPLVAIVFWSVAGGLPRAARWLQSISLRSGSLTAITESRIAIGLRTALWASSLTTGLFVTLGPLGLPFWDPGSTWSWRKLYAPSRRAEMFAAVVPLIPQSSRVASTDFVHPRFTHHERSYDYSAYQRQVSDYEQRVPADTDFIVIDTGHRYSNIHRPEEVPEYRDHPDQWELLPDETNGYFIILRRRR